MKEGAIKGLEYYVDSKRVTVLTCDTSEDEQKVCSGLAGEAAWKTWLVKHQARERGGPPGRRRHRGVLCEPGSPGGRDGGHTHTHTPTTTPGIMVGGLANSEYSCPAQQTLA